MIWQATVLINNIPTPMTFTAPNAVAARAYFESFGRVVSDLRILSS
jgi:hypothetical protein